MTNLVQMMSTTAYYLAAKSVKVSHSATMCFCRFVVAYNHVIVPGEDIRDAILCAFVIFMALSGKHRSIRTYLDQ